MVSNELRQFLEACRASDEVRVFSTNLLVALRAASSNEWQGIFEGFAGGQDEPAEIEEVLNLISSMVYEQGIPLETLNIVAQGA